MGHMVKQIYIGAFISLEDPNDKESGKKFQNIVRDDDFYCRFGEDERLMIPYQGLEDVGILIPNSMEYCVAVDYDNELVINKKYIECVNFKEMEDKLRRDYGDELNYLNNIFYNKVIVDSGIISYWNECA